MSLKNRSTLHYEVDDVFDLIVLSNDKNVQKNFDDVTRRASFIYRLPHPLDLTRGWQVALVKMTIPVTDNSQVQVFRGTETNHSKTPFNSLKKY